MTLFEPLLFEPHNKFLADATLALGLAHAYAYDDIGNRKTTTTNGQTATTTPNHLNQYAQRTVPPALDVSGAAAATVTVAVNNTPPQPTTRQGETFFKQLTVDNSVAAQNPTLTITSVENLVGPNGEDAVTQVTKTAFLARSPETFTHDADGNLTDDARWRYTWDAENRLVALETTTLAAAAGTTCYRFSCHRKFGRIVPVGFFGIWPDWHRILSPNCRARVVGLRRIWPKPAKRVGSLATGAWFLRPADFLS